jgi:hypothetical protein
MSSTTNVQNFLVNVFRPVYTYDATTTLFTPKLELSNIDNYSGNTVSVFTAAIGDSNSNVYVGSNAGNPFTLTKACRNNVALGYNAGSNISNVSNSTYLGYNAGAGAVSASNVVSIGANTNGNGNSNVTVGVSAGGTGSSNVFVGAGSTGAGDSNVYLGAGNTGTGSNCIVIGTGISMGSSNLAFRVGNGYLTGDMTTKWLGLGTTAPYDANNKMDISGNLYVLGQVGINEVPVRTLDVNGNFRATDAFGTLDFSNGVTTSSNGFASAQGTTTVSGGATTIGVLKKGIVLVSAVDDSDSANRAARVLLAYTTSNVTEIGSNVADGNTSLTLSSSDIQITDATNATYTWSITYFPLP